MADPIVVSAVQDAFEPLLVINNKAGKDVEVLKRFDEPAWNYQVIRFFDEKGEDIIPRKDKVWSKPSLLPRMIAVLEHEKQEVPAYLKLHATELDTKKHRKVALAMFCFWTGEMKLGQVAGVVNTEAGWLDGREVTLVTYHVDQVKLEDLVKQAQEVKCANKVYLSSKKDREQVATWSRLEVGQLDDTYRAAKADDQKKQIQKLKLPEHLTPAQVTKLNAWYRADKKKALSFLTNSQRKGL